MGSQFDAAHGQMGELDFYVTSMKLGELARNVGYAERDLGGGAEAPPDLLRQRKLNLGRVRQEMKPYLTDNPDHFFSALTVEVIRPGEATHDLNFVASADNADFGRIYLDGSEELQAIDGQHRLKAIQLALEEKPELARESVAVVLIPHRSNQRSQQVFSDLNRYAKTPSKTLNILFEHREFEANVAKEWARMCSAFKDGRTNFETNSLVTKSRHLITLSVLYECVRDFIGKDYSKKVWASRQHLLQEATRVASELAEWYDGFVVPGLPDLQDAIAGRIRPVELRSQFIYPHSIGWRAIAQTVRRAKDQRPDAKDLILRGFRSIDWRIINPEWEGSAMVAATVANRRQNIARASTMLSIKLGLDVTTEEREDLLKALRNINQEAVLPQVADQLTIVA